VNQFDHDIRAKDVERARLQADMDAFLKKGGQIQRPSPEPPKFMSMREISDAAFAKRISE